MKFSDRIELALHEYFVFEAVLGDYCVKERIFPILGKLFRLTDREIEEFLAKVSQHTVANIRDENEYFRKKRINEYLEFNGETAEYGYSEEEEYLIALKGNAVTQMQKLKMVAEKQSAAYSVYGDLIEKASAGILVALRILGILRCTGIGMAQDLERGRKTLEHAAYWGDVVSAIALCEYGDGAREKYASVVLACLKNTPCEYLREEIFPDVAPTVLPDPNVRLLKKSMDASRVNKVMFDPVTARVVYSEVIDGEAKEALIFSGHRGNISEACELPLSLSYARPLVADRDVLTEQTFGRSEEVDRIMRNLANVDLRTNEVYAPLCLVSDSAATRARYFAAIKAAFGDANVARIKPPLFRNDLSLDKNHVFLRNLVEKKANVLVFFFEGEMERELFETFVAFLNGEERRRFRIQDPALSLDLGSVLPICICEKEYQRQLADHTDQIVIEPLGAAEKPLMIDRLYAHYCALYGIAAGTIAADVKKALEETDYDRIDAFFKKMLLNHRSELSGKEITMDLAKPYLKKGNGGSAFGFGGNV